MRFSRRLVQGAAALAVVLTVSMPPAGAITYGSDDGGGHPNVGALVFAGAFPYCSGTLIAPTVFLTAAHCDISYLTGTDEVAVTFDGDFSGPVATTAGSFVGHPDYGVAQSDPHDIAVVLLHSAPGLTPAQLPTAGSLSDAKVGDSFTAVGYGGEEPVPVPGAGVVIDYRDVRQVAVSGLRALRPAWLQLSQNPSTGDGGTCFGDSGGPYFVGSGAGETAIVGAVTITGDAVCRATGTAYRLDTDSARAFLAQFVALP